MGREEEVWEEDGMTGGGGGARPGDGDVVCLEGVSLAGEEDHQSETKT